MMAVYVLCVLLSISLYLNHGHRVYNLAVYIYKKLIKPKFKVDEYVMIDDMHFIIVQVCDYQKPYTYYCLPIHNKSGTMVSIGKYYHESRIKKIEGLLKALE